LSEDSENEEKKAQASSEDQSQNAEEKKDSTAPTTTTTTTTDSPSQPQKPKTAPMIGKPIGAPVTPRPISTPIGKPPTSSTPAGAQATSTPVTSRPVGTPVGTPVATSRPSVGTPVGTPRPSVGTAAPRPAGLAQAGPVNTTAPKVPASKPPESKTEISRRRFIQGLAIFGGLVAVASFAPLFPYMEGSVGAGTATPELPIVVNPNLPQNQLAPLKPADVGSLNAIDPNSSYFQYPYEVGNSNVNSDSFVQCVLIRLPKGFTGGGFSVTDPKTGDQYVALSRVCVHLWCLWSYNTNDPRGPVGACPCHGSTYVPGNGSYPKEPSWNSIPGGLYPGLAVAGPASLQTAPNNALPVIQLKIAADGSFHAIGRVGSVGCGQKC
jgi:Rieske Fe-S protein